MSKWSLNPVKLIGFFIVGFMVFTAASVILKDLPSHTRLRLLTEPTLFHVKISPNATEDVSHLSITVQKDKLLGGLLPSGFDERSCLSRHESVLYHKELRQKPSSYLISKLRKYEALHKQCGPHTVIYNRSVELIKSGQYRYSSDCNYLVWISYSGLGNRMLTLASAFLYALLTNRVLLVDPGVNMPDLFCEPFPGVSWLLPPDFPIIDLFNTFNQESPHCYGYMVKHDIIGNSTGSILPPFIYLHLAHDYDDQDKLFFCDQDQSILHKIPWLVMRTDNYFVPYLFLMPEFEQELSNLFPEKETIFHFLSRYLFHPTNSVWGLVMRYYQAYLAQADEKLGIQIRVFDTGVGPFKYVVDQITSCLMNENLLPQINREEPILNPSGKQKTIAVLITSLSIGYFEEFRNMYWEHPTVTGEIVGVYQPSQEEHQQTEKLWHERKALAEMYLLSLTDKLVTSAWSTFGYVAHGLGGLKPWILYKPENRTGHNPPCIRAVSLEPCFHAPPYYDCKKKAGTDTSKIVPHVRHCEDVSWGLKLFDQNVKWCVNSPCFDELMQYVKCGFLGENCPTSVLPCVVGMPMLRYEESLMEQNLKIDPTECKILLTNPPLNPSKNRENMVETITTLLVYSSKFKLFKHCMLKIPLYMYESLGHKSFSIICKKTLDRRVWRSLIKVEGSHCRWILSSSPHEKTDVAGQHITSYMVDLLLRRGYDYKREYQLGLETTILVIYSYDHLLSYNFLNLDLIDVEGDGMADMISRRCI